MRCNYRHKATVLEIMLRRIWNGESVASVCVYAGISENELYEWVTAYSLLGVAGLKNGAMHAYRKELKDGSRHI